MLAVRSQQEEVTHSDLHWEVSVLSQEKKVYPGLTVLEESATEELHMWSRHQQMFSVH